MLAEGGVHVREDHALSLELLVHLVVDGLGLVLRADAGEELPLGLGDAELVEGVLDVLGHLVPGVADLLGGADEVVDVLEVDLVEVPAPLGGRPALVVLVGLEAEVAHPLRLGLVLGDRLDELPREALRRLVRVAGLGVGEAEALLVVGADVLEAGLGVGQDLGGLGCGGFGRWLHSRSPASLRRHGH